jgi:hypothetical protein
MLLNLLLKREHIGVLTTTYLYLSLHEHHHWPLVNQIRKLFDYYYLEVLIPSPPPIMIFLYQAFIFILALNSGSC